MGFPDVERRYRQKQRRHESCRAIEQRHAHPIRDGYGRDPRRGTQGARDEKKSGRATVFGRP